MKKILIIEDDSILGHIYTNQLTKAGYQVELFADGKAGYSRLTEFMPDGVLLDLMLPNMNGLDILKQIRAQANLQKVPIVVFTNAYVPNMIEEAYLAGATQVFNKATLTPRQIVDSLNAAIFPAHDTSGKTIETPPDPYATRALNRSPALEQRMAPESPFHAASDSMQHADDNPNSPRDTTPSITGNDELFRIELITAFRQNSSSTLADLRSALKKFTQEKEPDQSADDVKVPEALELLYRRIHSLTGSAGIAGASAIAQVSSALEVLLREIIAKPKTLTSSTKRTIVQTVDFLGALFGHGDKSDLMAETPKNIMVVDDEILSRRAITYALEKARLKSISVEDPKTALELAKERTFDLVFVDVQMPYMDGFELCTKIRATPNNKSTPVIFVTSQADFGARTRSMLSGGNELIAKPFLFIEVTVKALITILGQRLKQSAEMAASGKGI